MANIENVDLLVQPIDETFVRLRCSKDLSREIREVFSFQVDGYQFMERYRAGVWDGYIRLYNDSDKQFYKGLLPRLKEWSDLRGLSMAFSGFEVKKTGLTLAQTKTFCESLKLPWELYEHQLQYIHHGITRKRGLLISPTNSGKSLIIYCLIRFMLKFSDMKILLIVPRVDLVDQMFGDFVEYSEKNGWNVHENCHQVTGGVDKNTVKRVVISTWQSVYKLPKSFFQEFGMLLGDEVHQFKATCLKELCEKSSEAFFKLGLTGTLDKSLTNEMVLEGLYGPKVQFITQKEMIEQKISSNLSIKMLQIQYDGFGISKKIDYKSEIEFINECEERTETVCRMILSRKKNSMVLYDRVKHGKTIVEQLKKMAPDRNVYLIHGGVGTDVRKEIRKIVETETDAIIVASYGTFSTGISIKNINYLFFASFSKSYIRVVQSIGRLLRKGKDTEVVLYDIFDDFLLKNGNNYSMVHAIERMKIYKTEEFPFTVQKIKLHKK